MPGIPVFWEPQEKSSSKFYPRMGNLMTQQNSVTRYKKNRGIAHCEGSVFNPKYCKGFLFQEIYLKYIVDEDWIYSRCLTWWFEVYIHHVTIISIKLMNIICSSIFFFFVLGSELKAFGLNYIPSPSFTSCFETGSWYITKFPSTRLEFMIFLTQFSRAEITDMHHHFLAVFIMDFLF